MKVTVHTSCSSRATRRKCSLVCAPQTWGCVLSFKQACKVRREWPVHHVRCCAGSSDGFVTDNLSELQHPLRNPETLKARYTASALAFLGDALWSLNVRRHYLLPPKHPTKYHAAVDRHSAAEAQAAYYDQLLGLEPPSNSNSSLQEQRVAEFSMAKHYQLTADEQAIVQWALSEPASYRKRFKGREEAQLAYRKATAFEALIGYLALTDKARLTQLMEALIKFLPEQ